MNNSPFPNPKSSKRLRNQIKPINSQKLRDKESFKRDLDTLYGNIEELLRNECLMAYPELSFALQDVNELIEKMDTDTTSNGVK